MLVNLYSYRVMEKSVSCCCVRGRRVISNPVTYVSLYVHQQLLCFYVVDNASELLVSLSTGNLEDFYPSAAIASLMKILKDPSLSQHHTMVIQVLNT